MDGSRKEGGCGYHLPFIVSDMHSFNKPLTCFTKILDAIKEVANDAQVNFGQHGGRIYCARQLAVLLGVGNFNVSEDAAAAGNLQQTDKRSTNYSGAARADTIFTQAGYSGDRQTLKKRPAPQQRLAMLMRERESAIPSHLAIELLGVLYSRNLPEEFRIRRQAAYDGWQNAKDDPTDAKYQLKTLNLMCKPRRDALAEALLIWEALAGWECPPSYVC